MDFRILYSAMLSQWNPLKDTFLLNPSWHSDFLFLEHYVFIFRKHLAMDSLNLWFLLLTLFFTCGVPSRSKLEFLIISSMSPNFYHISDS